MPLRLINWERIEHCWMFLNDVYCVLVQVTSIVCKIDLVLFLHPWNVSCAELSKGILGFVLAFWSSRLWTMYLTFLPAFHYILSVYRLFHDIIPHYTHRASMTQILITRFLYFDHVYFPFNFSSIWEANFVWKLFHRDSHFKYLRWRQCV